MGYTFFQINGFGEVFYAFRMSDWLGKFICVLLLLISGNRPAWYILKTG